MELNETTLSGETRFVGRVFSVRVDQIRLPDGRTAEREVVEHHGGVCVAALTPEDELLLVRQYRYAHASVLLEVPAGKLEPGETPLECGRRELLEETGAIADCCQDLGRLLPTPGYCGETIYMYAAKISHYTAANPDEDEFVEVVRLPLSEAVRRVLDNEITDGKTQVCILKLWMLRERGLLFAPEQAEGEA